MMNPQFMPPGQNNNGQSNLHGFPLTQDLNGHPNQNLFSQMAPNEPDLPITPNDQSDVTHKMQNLGLNGSQGFNIPSGQMPPMKPPELQHNKQFMPPSQTPPSMSSNQLNMARPPGSEGSSTLSYPQQSAPMPGLPHMPPPLDQNKAPVNQSGISGPTGSGFHGMPQSTLTNQLPPTSQSSAPISGQKNFPNQIQPPNFPGSNQQRFQSSGQPNIAQGQPPYPGTGQSPFPNPEHGLPPTTAPSQAGFSGPNQHTSRPNQQAISAVDQTPPPTSISGTMGTIPGSGSALPLNSGPGQMPFSGSMPPPMSRPGEVPVQSVPNQSRVQTSIPSSGQPSLSNQTSMPAQPSLPGSQHLHQNLPHQPPLPNQSSMFGQPSPASLPGQTHLAGQPTLVQHPISGPGLPPLAGQSFLPGFNQPSMSGPGQQFPGRPPLPGHTQLPGQQFIGQPGQPPLPGHQLPGQPPVPGQPPLPGQQFPVPPPLSSGHLPGQPLLPGQPPFPGPGQPTLSAQQPQFNQPHQQNRPPMMHPTMPGPQVTSQFPGSQGQHQMQGHPAPPGHPPGQMPSGYPPQYQQPPFPGQQPSYPQHPQHPQYAGYQQPQQPVKKLDPDQMPSPINVMIEDQRNRGGIFVTNDRGLVPPLVTTDFVVDDKGNSSPRYMRSSMYSVPVTADLLKQTSLPLCLVISPMAELEGSEQEPPLLDFAALTNSPTMGPVRCSRCKAYMCPNMKFIDAGRHFKCAFCKATTEVPMEYTQYINSMQQYGRMPSELALGTYEIVATKEYCRNNTMPNIPAIVFVIDVSYNAVKSGLVHTVCDNITRIVDALPKDAEGNTYTRLGFITYSSTVHFYNIKGTRGQPQMLSVGDVSDMFVPLLDGFLVTAHQSGDMLPTLLRQIPTTFSDNKETEIVLLPAVQAGLEALKAADTAGQLLVFHSSLPTYPAPGKLTNREDRKLLGTDKEKQVLAPANTTYNEVGQSCSAAGVCVDLFIANNSYVDLPTIGQLARLTGGQVHKYTYFQADMDGERLVQDAVRVVTRPVAHDAVMRVRTSTGVRATDFYGHFYMSNTTDVELAAVDSDKAIGVEIKHDDKLSSEEAVYVQAALLYTHRTGQRRLRILNLALSVASQLADVYRSCDLDTLINFLTKQAVWYLRETPPRAVSDALTARCAKALASYRRHCATPSSAGQLVLPESCKLLPLYTSCMLRGDALGGGPELTVDDRWLSMAHVLSADIPTSVAITYPRLLALHVLPDPPVTLRDSADKMEDRGVYLLENGVHMLVWVGSQTSAAFTQQVFGVASPQQVDTRVAELPVLDNPLSEAVRDIITDARLRRRRYMRLTLMRQHDKLEAVLRHFLVEDRGVDGHQSYVDYLCHIHKEIRNML